MSKLSDMFSMFSNNDDDDKTAVEQKDDEKNNTTTTTTDDWIAFAETIPTNLFYTFFLVLLGINIIFYGALDPTSLNKFFPSEEEDDYFQPPKNCDSGLEGGRRRTSGKHRRGGSAKIVQKGGLDDESRAIFNNNWSCERKIVPKNKCATEKLGIGRGLPYTLDDGGGDGEISFSLQGIKNWFAQSEASTWKTYRGFMKTFITTLCTFDSDPVTIILGGIAMVMVSYLMMMIIPGAVLNGFCQITTKGGGEGAFWSPLAYTFFPGMFGGVMLVTGFIMFLNFILSFTILPLMSEPSIIANIMICNHKFIGLIFGFMMAGSASSTLDSTTAGCMWATWAVAVLLWFFKG